MSKRIPLVAGNWKLHKTIAESRALARELKNRLAASRTAQIAVAPVFTSLSAVASELEGSRIEVAGQDCYHEAQGAFTGAVSPALIKDTGCSMCIIGHSERRQLFGETDPSVNKKLHALLAANLTPIVCLGETLEQRESGATLKIVEGQLTGCFANVAATDLPRVVIAYEPVWAIGTGRTASPSDAQEVHAALRSKLGSLYDARAAAQVRILYGGSVKADNAAALMSQEDIDGALVGGASLSADSFVAIVQAAG